MVDAVKSTSPPRAGAPSKEEEMTLLKIECMYCGVDMGMKDGRGEEGVTTSICEKCWRKVAPPGVPWPGSGPFQGGGKDW